MLRAMSLAATTLSPCCYSLSTAIANETSKMSRKRRTCCLRLLLTPISIISSEAFVSTFTSLPPPPALQQRPTHHQGCVTTSSSVLSLSTNVNSIHIESHNPYDDAEPASPPPLPSDSSVPRPTYLPPPPPLPKVQLLRRRLISDPKSPSPYDDIPDNSEDEWEFFFGLYKQFAEETLQEDMICDHDGEKENAKNNDKQQSNNDARIQPRKLILKEPSPGPLAHQSPLRNWIADQRKSYMKTIGILDLGAQSNWGTPYLLRSYKERLDSVGFAWGHIERRDLTDDELYSSEFRREVETKYKDWIWAPIYERLKLYKEKYGHTHVPLREASGLGTWTAFQRTIRHQMPARRRQKLDSLNFDWNYWDPSEDKDWLEGLFRGNWTASLNQKNGIEDQTIMEDLPIPVEEVIARTAIPPQWRWTQRLGNSSHTNNSLDKKSKTIDSIGGITTTSSKSKAVSWAQRLKDLKAYKEKYGDLNVPIDYDEPDVIPNPGLGKWLKRTRRNKKLSLKSRLALERIGVTLDYS